MATTWELLVSGKDLNKVATERRLTYRTKKEYAVAKDVLAEEGWEYVSTLKNEKYIKVRKDKDFDEVFEDKVWTMFFKMGFFTMNKDRNFRLQSDINNPDLTKQIDIFAVDEDTVFIVECKASRDLSSAVLETKKSFKTDLEALRGNKESFQKVIKNNPSLSGKKVICIWATQNIQLGLKDKERLKEWDIVHFDDKTVQYYSELADHLGSSARYQLLGNLLQGTEIKNISMVVPAIRGQMGNHTYYSFSIEPSKLLKIGYVLHRSQANSNMMPTYQRIIKRNRLIQIRDFVNKGGYFPNSIIVSIDTHNKKMVFDAAPVNKGVEDTKASIGYLHLPAYYHSAYIIDGQHRLYGYTDSKFADSDVVPVVAFENLDRGEQLKMFMDINENQKAVSKSLRSTLNKDLFWDSKDPAEQRKALCSKISQAAGEDSSSPLYNRIAVGEDPKTTVRCISVDVIPMALKKTAFLTTYKKDHTIDTNGTFDVGDLDKTYDLLYPFLLECLRYIQNECVNEWTKGKEGMLTIDRGVYGMIRVIDDVVNELIKHNMINPKHDKVETMVGEAEKYLEPLTVYINNLTEDESKSLKSTFGTNGYIKFYRYFEKAIHDELNSFNPAGLTEYIEDQTKKYNDQSREYLRDIEARLRDIFKEDLTSEYGTKEWIKRGVPKDIAKDIHVKAYDRNLSLDDDHQLDDWDCIEFNDMFSIATFADNWDLFEAKLTPPDDDGKRKKRTETIGWISEMGEVSSHLNNSSYSVNKALFDRIESVYNWVCKGDLGEDE